MKILKEKEVRIITGLSRTTIFRLIKAKQFPIPIRLSERRRAWRQTDIDEWIQTRKPAYEINSENSSVQND